MTPMPRRTVTDVLACFEDEFATTSAAFAQGQCALWLGSGISRGVVSGVDDLLRDLLTFLQTQVDPADSDCRFNASLQEILDVTGVPSTLRASIDLAQPVEDWARLEDLIEWLRDKYATVLDVPVDNEEADFLLWTGIDAASRYGSPDLNPDVEHLCVAVLMLEGVVRIVPTTNWDGLVEMAVAQIASHPDALLRVVVSPEDFASPERPAELVKFHGCAVRALADEASYRDRMIARESQISAWASKPDNRIMKDRLEYVLASQPAFIVGLSAQDANIHTMFNEASRNLVRTWPEAPPAMVCATEKLGGHHKHMLKVVYGDAGYAASRADIEESALLGAYAKPALLAMVLFVLGEKLCVLLENVSDLALTESEVGLLQDDIRSLRDAVGALADADVGSFTQQLIAVMRFLLLNFRAGHGPAVGATHYEPLTVRPVTDALEDPNFPGDGLGRLAIAVSLLGRGHLEREWELSLELATGPGDGVVCVTSESGHASEVFIVKDAAVLSKLEANGRVDVTSGDALVISAESTPVRMTRSPRPRYGRTGSSGAREIDLAALCGAATSADELFKSFRLEGAL